MQDQVEQIVQQITQWANSHQSILAAALVGSQARGRGTRSIGTERIAKPSGLVDK